MQRMVKRGKEPAENDEEKWVWVLAIRQRLPYDYEDLPELMAKMGE